MVYVIKSKDSVFEEYVLLVVEQFIRWSNKDQILWDFGSTDTLQDATKFLCEEDAVVMMMSLRLHEDDWEVVPLES